MAAKETNYNTDAIHRQLIPNNMMLYIDKRPDANLFKLLTTNMYPFPHKKDTEALNMQPAPLSDIMDAIYICRSY
jgi:hypothetical protein